MFGIGTWIKLHRRGLASKLMKRMLVGAALVILRPLPLRLQLDRLAIVLIHVLWLVS